MTGERSTYDVIREGAGSVCVNNQVNIHQLWRTGNQNEINRETVSLVM